MDSKNESQFPKRGYNVKEQARAVNENRSYSR
jgi:hypothetical protein